jgi:hypothetical protein
MNLFFKTIFMAVLTGGVLGGIASVISLKLSYHEELVVFAQIVGIVFGAIFTYPGNKREYGLKKRMDEFLDVEPEEVDTEMMHMCLCEAGHIIPRPYQHYIFVHVRGCDECDRLAVSQAEAYGWSSPVVNEDGSLPKPPAEFKRGVCIG